MAPRPRIDLLSPRARNADQQHNGNGKSREWSEVLSLPRRARHRGLAFFTALLGVVVFIGLGLAVLVLSQSSLDIRPTDGAAINREFDGVRRRFPATQAYITVDRNGRVAATVHHDVEPATPGRIKTVQGVAWDPASGRRVSVSTPYWVFQATRWKAKALGTVVKRFDQQLGLDVDLPDLAPLGPGLVLDERYPDGRRVLVWTE